LNATGAYRRSVAGVRTVRGAGETLSGNADSVKLGRVEEDLPAGAVQPLDYQSPRMPPGALLTFTEYPDGGKLERGPATFGEMLREAMGPPVSFLFLGFLLCVGIIQSVRLRRRPGPPVLAVAMTGTCFVALATLVWTVLDAAQNAGIVTEVEVRGPSLSWRKQNFWGTRRREWRTADVESVYVGPFERMLRIGHRSRISLGAFSRFPRAELDSAVALLTLAIARAKAASQQDR